MRLLVAIPHFFAPIAAVAQHGSLGEEAHERATALHRAGTALLRLFGHGQSLAHLVDRQPTPANQQTRADVDILICTHAEDHVLDAAGLPGSWYRHVPTDVEPACLGFACQRALRERAGNYDYYGYLEDDLVIHDPWFFAKLASFGTRMGKETILLPNRYEIGGDGVAKVYIDGDLAPPFLESLRNSPAFAHSDRLPRIVAPYLGLGVTLVRPGNPHAGCWFASRERFEMLCACPDFGVPGRSFVGPLETAATLAIAKTFRIYKPHARVASFLEIEHCGQRWIRRFEDRSRGGRATLRTGAVSEVAQENEPPQSTGTATRSQRKLLVQCMMMPTPGCQHVRIVEPNRMLKSIPGVRTLAQVNSITFSDARPDEEKIVVWQRPLLDSRGGVERLRKLLRRGYLVVVDCDDDPFRRHEHRLNDFLPLRGCHAIQTSTDALADVLREFNPHVAVFENQLAELPPPPEYCEGDVPVRIFFGAIAREYDWAPLVPELHAVIESRGERIEFQVLHDQRFFEALPTAAKSFDKLARYERYLELLAEADVAILPLADTRKNRLKSDLKFIECASRGVAVLASPVVYESTIEDGSTGMIFRSPAEFGQKLLSLVDDPALRRRLGEAAYAYVRDNRLLSQHFRKRYEWYIQLRSRLPELTRDLARRVGELA